MGSLPSILPSLSVPAESLSLPGFDQGVLQPHHSPPMPPTPSPGTRVSGAGLNISPVGPSTFQILVSDRMEFTPGTQNFMFLGCNMPEFCTSDCPLYQGSWGWRRKRKGSPKGVAQLAGVILNAEMASVCVQCECFPSPVFQVTAQERPGWEDGASPDPKAAAWGGLWEQSKHTEIFHIFPQCYLSLQ